MFSTNIILWMIEIANDVTNSVEECTLLIKKTGTRPVF